MYLALHDIADPSPEAPDDYESTKNPESYAWFALALYMTLEGGSRQDWSTGACRADAPDGIASVTASGSKVPRAETSFRSLTTLLTEISA